MNNEIKNGFLLINKPCGMSSYACINYIKKIIKQKAKIGHTGTLDPFAQGLLIIAIGRSATRLIDHVMKLDKTYIAVGKCGELTDTLDCTGTIIQTNNIIPSQEQLAYALESFGSSYEQIPPVYSALKYKGKPLYLLSRKRLLEEEELQHIAVIKKRMVYLYHKELVLYNPPFFTIKVCVSPGTYIRTLINDIAVKAGSCATTYELTRSAIGHFTLDQAIDLKEILTIEQLNDRIFSLDDGLN